MFNLAEASPIDDDPMSLYSFWFEKAYPHPSSRRDILKKEMEGKSPSAATLRLAHLLSSRKLSTFVVTSNFDDLLYQALLLFGRPPILCDHPATASRIELDNFEDVQIVHVHGSYNFYDVCNLKGEIAERSDLSQQRVGTMSFLLNQLLASRSPIVIGYSGWENDVIMTALRERLKFRPASLTYWFCYSKQSYESLPVWLQANEYVRFIIPNEVQLQPAGDDDEQFSDPRHEHTADEAVAVESAASHARMPAVHVFDTLIQKLKISEPLVTRDPFEYLAQRLEPIFEHSTISPQIRTDNYDFPSVAGRLRIARDRENAERAYPEQTLEHIRAELRQSAYDRAYKVAFAMANKFVAEATVSHTLTLREFLELFSLAIKNADSEIANNIVEAFLSAVTRLRELEQDNANLFPFADALRAEAGRITRAQKSAAAVDLINRTISQIAEATDEPTVKVRLDLLLGKATNLLAMNVEDEEAYSILDEIVGYDADTADSRVVMHAYLHKARAKQSYDAKAALQSYEAAIDRFNGMGGSSRDYIEAIGGAARTSNKIRDYEKTLAFATVAEKMLQTTKMVRDRVALKRVFVSKAIALAKTGRIGEAIAAVEPYISLDEAERRVASAVSQFECSRYCCRLLCEERRCSASA